MKRALVFILIAVMAVISCSKEDKAEPYNPDGSLITQAQALEIVKEDIDQYDVVLVSKSVVKKGKKFKTYLDRGGTVPCDSWVVIINTNTLANSGPFWLYIYVDPYSCNADRDSWEWGMPDSFECDIVKYQVGKNTIESTVQHPSFAPSTKTRAINPESNNWAVIISGGMNPSNNHERYWNDCSAIYKCLRTIYNYRRDRIIILMSDGKSSGLDRIMNNGLYASSPQDLDGDGIGDINYSATKSNITRVFNYLEDNVQSNEQVLIYVTDHGSSDDRESYICLWNDTMISASDFAKEVKKIDYLARKHIVLGQCFSGGFVGPLLSACYNISVATASAKNEYSYAMNDGKYEEFLYHWVSAAAGKTPDDVSVNADKNGYEGVSSEEMFLWAKEKDIQIESPQYSSKPESFGERYGLSGVQFGYPELSGPRHISSNPINGIFELTGLPDNCTVNWISTDKIMIEPLSTFSSTARSISDAAMDRDWVCAEIATPLKTYLLKWWTHLWRPGWNVTTDLISGSILDEKLSLPYYVEGTDDYDWFISCPDYDSVRSDTYFIDFTYIGDGNPGPYYVSVKFNNPLGEETTIVRYYD